VGWQVYALTKSAFDLGMVGLAQFIPTVVLTFAAGRADDRYERRRVAQFCQIAEALSPVFLAWGQYRGMAQRVRDLCGGGRDWRGVGV